MISNALTLLICFLQRDFFYSTSTIYRKKISNRGENLHVYPYNVLICKKTKVKVNIIRPSYALVKKSSYTALNKLNKLSMRV